MRQRGFSAWVIQIGPVAALEARFVMAIFNLPHPYTGRSFHTLPYKVNMQVRTSAVRLFLLIALVSPLMLQTFRIKYRMSLKIMIMKLNMKSNM